MCQKSRDKVGKSRDFVKKVGKIRETKKKQGKVGKVGIAGSPALNQHFVHGGFSVSKLF